MLSKVEKLDGYSVAPPPEEPQTAAPESPTVSSNHTMSPAHVGCLLASEEQQTRSVEAGCKVRPDYQDWRAKSTPALAPPPEEPQTAAPESPTVSGHRTVSIAHAGCLLASEEQQTRSVEALWHF